MREGWGKEGKVRGRKEAAFDTAQVRGEQGLGVVFQWENTFIAVGPTHTHIY